MSRQTELEELVFHEAFSMDGIAVMVRMGQDPGAERMASLISAMKELDEILRGQTVLDRRLAYAFWSLASSLDGNLHSWAREGRQWRPELIHEELYNLLLYVEYLFEGGLTKDEADEET
ncbi:MAG: hypothetical protein MUF48_11000 [Pirellulaceae bacterium]|nr:hypothetical protein [Pirellulaceae bacterium]